VEEILVADSNISNLLGLARSAQLAGNSEEAMAYFNRVLEADPSISEAWLGKGKAAGWQSTLVNIRTGEALVAFNHAIATAPDIERGAVTTEVVGEINRLVVALYGMARRQLDQFVAIQNTWVHYLNQVSQLLDALEEVRKWAPLDRITLENIVHLCKDNIEGIRYNDPYDYNAAKSWQLGPQYEVLIRARLDSAAAELKEIDPNYAVPVIQKKTAEACFVVTATMGNSHHPTVFLMRRFRDEWLAQRSWGETTIIYYYRVGPSVARLIGSSWLLRKLSFLFVVAPVASVARFLMKTAR
jgi:tetratricopeptide (TPR) repeat protein